KLGMLGARQGDLPRCRRAGQSLHEIVAFLRPANRVGEIAQLAFEMGEREQHAGLGERVAFDKWSRDRVSRVCLLKLAGPVPCIPHRLVYGGEVLISYVAELPCGLDRARIEAGGVDVGVRTFGGFGCDRCVSPYRAVLTGFVIMQREDVRSLVREIEFLFEMRRDRAVQLAAQLER